MFSPTLRRVAAPALAALCMLGSAPRAMAQSTTVPEDTVVRVRLDETLDSKTARINDRVTATVANNDRSGFPEGTKFEGRITDAQRSSKDQPGVLGMDFKTAILPDGQRVAIDGSLTGLTEEDVRRSSDGRMTSRKRGGGSKMDLKWVGYGAAGGAVLGTLFGGNLLKGALLGGLGGAVYGYLNKDKNKGEFRDVSLSQGTEFGVQLNRRVAFNERGNYRYGYRPAEFDEDRYYSDRTYRERVLGERDEARFGDVTVRMNGRNVNFANSRPMHVNGILYVPLSEVAQAGNLRFNHVRGDESFVLRTRNGNIRGTAGETRLSGRGSEDLNLTQAPISINGEIYVPAEFLTRVGDMRANWDRRTMRLDLETDNSNFR
jgi:hypothetical protein